MVKIFVGMTCVNWDLRVVLMVGNSANNHVQKGENREVMCWVEIDAFHLESR